MERDAPGRIRAFGGRDGSLSDLEFLKWFGDLRRFQGDVHDLRGIDGLRHLPADAERIGIGTTRRPLSRGHTKDLDVIAQLQQLADLTLSSVTVPDLRLLMPMTRLRALDLKLGGTTNLGLLHEIGRTAYLDLWQIRRLVDLSPDPVR